MVCCSKEQAMFQPWHAPPELRSGPSVCGCKLFRSRSAAKADKRQTSTNREDRHDGSRVVVFSSPRVRGRGCRRSRRGFTHGSIGAGAFGKAPPIRRHLFVSLDLASQHCDCRHSSCHAFRLDIPLSRQLLRITTSGRVRFYRWSHQHVAA